MATFALAGCMEDKSDVSPPGTGASSGITLNLSAPGMTAVTRSGFSENAVEELDVVVFDTSDKIVEHRPAEIIATGLGGGAVTQAYVPVTIAAGYTLAVIANAHGRMLSAASIGRTKESFLSTLIDQRNSADTGFNTLWNKGIVTPAGLPMYGEATLATVPTTAESVSIDMTRVHARIDVIMTDGVSDFTEILFNSFSDAGILSRERAENVILWGEKQDDAYIPGTAFTRAEEMFYVFEAPRVTESYYATSAHLVIRAKYDGSYYYYRINFTSDGSLDGYERGEYIPVIRNYKYVVDVTAVLGKGYATAAEASAAKDVLNNLNYTIHSIEESVYSNIWYDGQYMLALGTDTVNLTADGESADIRITTNHPSGWTAKLNSEAQSWFQMAAGPAASAVVWSSTSITSTASTIAVRSSQTTTPRSGVITLTAGRITAHIHLDQSAESAVSIHIYDTDGNDVESIVFRDGSTQPQSFLVRWSPETVPLNIVRGSNLGSRGGFSFGSASDNLGTTMQLTGGGAILTLSPPARNAQTEWGTFCTEYEFNATYLSNSAAKTIGILQTVPQNYSAYANCYMTVPGTKYGGHSVTFPVYQANRSELGQQLSDSQNFTARMIWTDSNKGQSIGGTVAAVSQAVAATVTDSRVKVTVGSLEGNTLVGVYNDSNTLLWSWHIWVTPYQPGRGNASEPSLPASPANNAIPPAWNESTCGDSYGVPSGLIYHYRYYPHSDSNPAYNDYVNYTYNTQQKYNVFLDRNLGATGVSLNGDGSVYEGPVTGPNPYKEVTFGLHYQWGRKVPFPGAAGYGAPVTEKPIYDANGDPVVITPESITTGTSGLLNNYQAANQNPTKFYTSNTTATSTTSPFDWYTGRYSSAYATAATYRNDNLWANTSVKSLDDPCPPGWRVPVSAPVTGETSTSTRRGYSTGRLPGTSATSFAINTDTSSGTSTSINQNETWRGGWCTKYSPWYGQGWYPWKWGNSTDFGGYTWNGLGWYPTSGYRSEIDGKLYNAGYSAGWWTCGTPGSRNQYRYYRASGLVISGTGGTMHDPNISGTQSEYVSTNAELRRARGLNVRCVME